MLALKRQRSTQKVRASWSGGTRALETQVSISLNETVIAKNKVSMVADRLPAAILSICNTTGAQSCSPASHRSLLDSPYLTFMSAIFDLFDFFPLHLPFCVHNIL